MKREPTTLPPNDLLTTMEVADFLRVSRSTVYRLVDEGRLHAVKIGPRPASPTSGATRITQASVLKLSTTIWDD